MTEDECWPHVRSFAEYAYPNAVKMTQLGTVTRVWKDGVLVNEIPGWLERVAAKYGLEVTAADFETNTYYLRLKIKEQVK